MQQKFTFADFSIFRNMVKTESREKEIYKVTIIGSIVNFIMVLLKFIAAVAGKSSAMLADAVHSLSDFITDIFVIVFVRLSSKPADSSHDYGHGKYETLATVIIGIALLVVGAIILAGSIESIINYFNGIMPEKPGWIAFTVAILSIVSKEILYRYTVIKGRQVKSDAVIANAWHHRSDALSSIGTTIGIGGAIFFGEKWRVLDPIAAAVVSLFIFKVAVELIKPGFDELLEKSLPKDIEDRIIKAALSVDGVSQPHNLRTRKIGNKYAIDLHIRLDCDLTLREAHDIATEVENRIRAELCNDTYVNIHVEPLKQS